MGRYSSSSTTVPPTDYPIVTKPKSKGLHYIVLERSISTCSLDF